MSATFCRGGLEAVDAVDRALGRRVRQAMDPAALEAIETASRVGWVPIACDVEMTRALFTVAGPARALEILRDSMVSALGGPMLRPLATAALALFASTPRGLLGWAPKVWAVIYRDAGELAVVDAGERAVDFVLSGLPPEIGQYPEYLLGMASVFEACFVLLKVPGSIVLMPYKPGDPLLRLRATW